MVTSNALDPPEPAASNLNGLCVLVVEDSWQVSTSLKRLLEARGADVAGPVATVSDAARLVSERPIDVALVDINLRGGELAYDLITHRPGRSRPPHRRIRKRVISMRPAECSIHG